MSSPIGHSLAGCITSLYKESTPGVIQFKLKSLVFYIIVANAPDLDFLPGLLLGEPNLYHHGISHSIGFGFLVSLVAAWLITRKGETSFRYELFFLSFCFGTHLILDFLSMDARPPYGIPVLWPFSSAYYMVPILPPVNHSMLDHATIGQFFSDAFSLHNLYVIGLEILLTVPFIFILVWRRKKNRTS